MIAASLVAAMSIGTKYWRYPMYILNLLWAVKVNKHLTQFWIIAYMLESQGYTLLGYYVRIVDGLTCKIDRFIKHRL